MPDSTLELPQQPIAAKLRAMMSDPDFQTLPPQEQRLLINAARTGQKINVGNGAPPSMASRPGTASFTRPDMPEISRQAKLSDQAQAIMRLGQEMQNLYTNRIAPKLKAGQISPMGQGLEYTYRGLARDVGYEPDPDVQEFITKSGQFATMVNSYYSAGAGGRGGVQAYQVITEPHIPHPPGGIMELLSGNWDLQKQGEQIPTILNNVQLEEKQRGVQDYSTKAPDSGDVADPVAAALAKHGVE